MLKIAIVYHTQTTLSNLREVRNIFFIIQKQLKRITSRFNIEHLFDSYLHNKYVDRCGAECVLFGTLLNYYNLILYTSFT